MDNQNEGVGLDYDFKQDLELFFFYLANQSMCRREHGDQFMFHEIMKQNPTMFVETSFIYLDALASGDFSSYSKEIYSYLKKGEILGLKGDEASMTPIECLKRLIVKLSKLIGNEELQDSILGCGSDLQLVICIWGNNIIVNTNGDVVNEEWASKRAFDFFEDDRNPPFEDWEVEHNT